MSYPDRDQPNHDLPRFIHSAFQDSDGNIRHDELFFASHAIRSDKIGAVAATYKSILAMYERLQSEMPPSIVAVLGPQIKTMADELAFAVSGKNSETVYMTDAGPQSMNALRNDMGKTTISHLYTAQGDAAKGFMSKFFGDANRNPNEGEQRP